MKVTVFSAHKFELEQLEKANQGKHELKFINTYLTPETAILATGSEAVSLFVNDNASAEVLKILKEGGVRYIALRSAGYNHVDLEKAKELGFRVGYVPDYSPYAVAEHTVALMLALNRKIVRSNNRVRDLNFSLDGLTGFDMNGKTAGIVGTGKIGAIVAKILNGFGCKLLGFDLNPDEKMIREYGMTYADLDTLYEQSDIITLHVPLNPHTHYLINEEKIAKMKRGVMLINTSRGGLVQTKAVINALKTGQVGYLGLDVYEEEKGLFFEDHSENILQDDTIARLLTFSNVIVTSHQGFLTKTALQNIADATIYNIDCWETGKRGDHELV